MRLRLSIPAVLAAVALASCGGESTLSFTILVNRPAPSQVIRLIDSTEDVINRRLAALGETQAIVSAVPTGGSGGTLSISLPNAENTDLIRGMVSEPFTFEIRMDDPTTGSGEDLKTDWQPTGIIKEHLDNVRTLVNSETGEAAIELNFTPEGRRLLADVFVGNRGKSIGIFVRGLLMSALRIENEEINDRIVISGVPSPAIARVFEDDVNVGLYVTLTPSDK